MLKTIVGQIEVVGPHRNEMGTQYDYIRFASGGQVHMVENVVALKLVASYLLPGAEGTFCISQNGGWNPLFAVRTEGRIASDFDQWEEAHGQAKLVAWLSFLFPVCALGLAPFLNQDAAQMAVMVGGLGLLPCWWFSYKHLAGARLSKMPDRQQVEAALKAA
jgi:hypothetical protein